MSCWFRTCRYQLSFFGDVSFHSLPLFGDASFPLSMEALGRTVGGDDDGPATLDACRRWCGVRVG